MGQNKRNDLREYFDHNKKKLIHKWDHYFEIYDRHFSPYRNKPITILEIGVFQGGSLQMWKKYFGSKAKIFGIDINPECKKYEEKNIEIFIGSQADDLFLEELVKKIPPIDILIDDGGHTMRQLKTSFNKLFEHVKPNGIYAAEDLHTCYWVNYGGGCRRMGTFIEYSKHLIDSIHAWHSEQNRLRINDFTRSIHSLHYYDSILMIEKRKMDQPFPVASGINTTSEFTHAKTDMNYIRQKFIKALNLFLRFFRLPSLFQ